jgi:RNA polymerase sigma-70 factor (ECF subfamily)
MAGHPPDMREVTAPTDAERPPPESAPLPSFVQIYEQYFEFIWRSARRLGVAEGSVDDVVQDVFVTAYRKLPVFEGRSQLKTWLFGILRHTVQDQRRSRRRKPTEELTHELVDHVTTSPEGALAQAQGSQLLHAVLSELSDDAREVFVLSELEQLSAPEVSAALSLNVNTVYSRLRSARQDFDAALKRLRAREEGRHALLRASRSERSP